jgi:hypothetical protein
MAPGGFLVLGRDEAAAGLIAAPGLPGCFTKPAAARAAA